MEGKRSLSGAGIRYRGRVRKILCDCNSDVMDTGLNSFFLFGPADDECPICAHPYHYKRDDQPVVKEGEQPGNYSVSRLVEERGPGATLIGGVVEYRGEIVTVQCRCSGCGLIMAMKQFGKYNVNTFDDGGSLDGFCPICAGPYYYIVDESIMEEMCIRAYTDEIIFPMSRGASHLLTHPTVKPGGISNFDSPLSTLRDVLPDVWGRKEHAEYMARQKDIEFYNSLQPAAGVRDGLKRIMASIKGDPIDHMTHGPEDKTN